MPEDNRRPRSICVEARTTTDTRTDDTGSPRVLARDVVNIETTSVAFRFVFAGTIPVTVIDHVAVVTLNVAADICHIADD